MGLRVGKDVGDRATLKDIQRAKESDPLYENMSEEDKKEVIDALIAYQEGKNLNARATSKGAVRDVFATMEKIKVEVC